MSPPIIGPAAQFSTKFIQIWERERERKFFKLFRPSRKNFTIKKISSSQHINKCNDELVIPKLPTCQNAHQRRWHYSTEVLANWVTQVGYKSITRFKVTLCILIYEPQLLCSSELRKVVNLVYNDKSVLNLYFFTLVYWVMKVSRQKWMGERKIWSHTQRNTQ